MNTTTTPTAYRVPEQNLGTLRARIEKINRRAARIGADPVSLDIGAPEMVERETVNDDGVKVKTYRKVYPVTLVGETPRIAGWTFVATVQHLGEAGNVLRKVPAMGDEAIPAQFRTASTNCDHCHVERKRKDTYILVSDAGEWKQVGSTCLMDFFGHDPRRALSTAEILFTASDALGEAEESVGGGGGGSHYFDLRQYLTFVAACVRVGGWVSRAEARVGIHCTATSDAALSAMFPAQGARKDSLRPEAIDGETADKVIAWGEALEGRADMSDYLFNLSVVFRSGVLDYRLAGIAASAIPTYMRETEQEIRRAKAAAISKHVGTVGQRQVFSDLTVTALMDYPGQYGTTTLVTFLDASGNVLKWWASNLPDALRNAEGKTFAVRATVKDHGNYRGVAETLLTRAALV